MHGIDQTSWQIGQNFTKKYSNIRVGINPVAIVDNKKIGGGQIVKKRQINVFKPFSDNIVA